MTARRCRGHLERQATSLQPHHKRLFAEEKRNARGSLLSRIGMIAVVTGAMESGEPREDSAVLDVEGWILERMTNEAMSER